MIGIIDYGAGNLRSVYNAFRYIGEDAKVCEDPDALKGVDKMVFPGVGSGKDAMDVLTSKAFIGPIKEHISKGRPFLGICLGLQLLFSKTEESGGCDCLDIVPGQVKLFHGGEGLKVPQIGWNTVKFSKQDCPIFEGIEDGAYFYFVHSYYCDNADPESTCGVTEYGLPYTSALWKDNMFAVQFHPERSQDKGLKILENFVKL